MSTGDQDYRIGTGVSDRFGAFQRIKDLEADCARLQQEINCLRMEPCQLPECINIKDERNTLKAYVDKDIDKWRTLCEQLEEKIKKTEEAYQFSWAECRKWKTLAAKMAEALRKMERRNFHIGNDENGNVYGPPDGVMCRHIAFEALAEYEKEAERG